MIAEVTPNDVIAYCRSILGIESVSEKIDDIVLTALLRRAAGMLCPCSRTKLRAALVDSLRYLHDLGEELPERLDKLTEELIVVGDLLEFADVTFEESEAKGTWVFVAPPTYIIRKSGSVFLTGIVPDQDNFLPNALNSRVIHIGRTRVIKPEPDEDIAGTLKSVGFNELPESVWLKSPKLQSAGELLSKAKMRLAEEPRSAPVQGLEIIDPESKVTYYRGRWKTPQNQSGMFVARRPQEFGAPLWCLAELQEGELVRIIDLPLRADHWRGCDTAWYIQMAIDSERKEPQRYDVSNHDGDTVRFDFFSPIPIWAERRLMVFGKKCPGEKSLFAYEIPASEAMQEKDFLHVNLWLAPLKTDPGARKS